MKKTICGVVLLFATFGVAQMFAPMSASCPYDGEMGSLSGTSGRGQFRVCNYVHNGNVTVNGVVQQVHHTFQTACPSN